MSAAAAPRPDGASRTISTPGRGVAAAAGEPVMAVPVARGIAFIALAAWGTLHWMSMLEPAEPGRGWLASLSG